MVDILRTAATGLAAMGLALALAACSDDGPDRDDVVAKIRSDPQMAGTPDRAVDCLADWYMEHASAEQREAFVSGESSGSGAAPSGEPEAENAMLNCLKLATGAP